MLIFHEGLPRSGKSFAAIKDHVIPALQKGRKVFAYIEGLDHEKIAQAAEITIEDCRSLLVQITAEQVPTIYDHVENDALVVIDELQDFWPSGRQKLDPDITKFITQHGHRGLDLLLMGQVLGDCHALWKNRVDQLVHFYKRDAIGKENEYKWSVQKRGSNQKFQEVTSGVCKYDPKYFGCYASHAAGTENKGNYKDERANVFSSNVVRRVLPMYGIAAVVALCIVVWAFQGGLAKSATKKAEEGKQPVAEQVEKVDVPKVQKATKAPDQLASDEYMPLPAPDVVDEFTSKYRIRLAGFMQFKGKMRGFVEWRDTDNGVKEQLSFEVLSGLGWLVLMSPDGQLATLQKVNKKYYVTAWPINDYRGKVSEAQIENIKPAASLPASPQTTTPQQLAQSSPVT